MLFADVSDLEMWWHNIPKDQQAHASVILEAASAHIATRCKQSGVDISAPDELLKTNLKTVCCNVTRRFIESQEERSGVKNSQQMVGPFMETLTFANSTGDFYMSPEELKSLGIGRQRISFTSPFERENHEW